MRAVFDNWFRMKATAQGVVYLVRAAALLRAFPQGVVGRGPQRG